jgi:transcriptional regulator with XRE-family HTH domain
MPRDDPQPGLGLAARRIRKRQRMTQDTLGKRAELHPTWISNIECGKVNPTWGNSRRLAYALGVTVRYLAALAEEMEDLRRPKAKVFRTVRRGQLGRGARKRRMKGHRRPMGSNNQTRRRPPTAARVTK